MLEFYRDDNFAVEKKNLLPVSIRDSKNVNFVEELLERKPTCVSFQAAHYAEFDGAGSYVLLDFGKELCGNIRFVTRTSFVTEGIAKFRVTLGESITEACSSIGEKNATNDHSPRDFVADIANMSDLCYGQSGFRFARIELLTETKIWMKNIYAVSIMPYFEKEAVITTSDEQLNEIIETAAHTLKLNFQNGHIWDGIKRDRLVWSGDLNQEIITSIYMYGDNVNVPNSLTFLRNETPADKWINEIPTYSAWWVINLCDYCRLTGNMAYFEENKEYAKTILANIDSYIAEDGTIDFKLGPNYMSFFLDWPSYNTPDAVIGTACLLTYAAKAFSVLESNDNCDSISRKLTVYLDKPCEFKQTRAFQVLAGRVANGEDAFLEANGADGFSTFMAYYILTADAKAEGKGMLSIIKEYFGAMLSRGATSFWEDFHMDWLEGSGRIDEFPKPGEKDIHGDYGAYCYLGFRHSLCHGWASGVLGFIIEHMVGLSLNGDTYEVNPHDMGVKEIHAKFPFNGGWLAIDIVDGKATVNEIA